MRANFRRGFDGLERLARYDRAVSSEPDHPPFFIVGNDRSGTTMLRLILDRSGDVAIPTESMFLGDLAGRRTVPSNGPGLADNATAQTFAETVWSHPKVQLWGLGGPAPRVPSGLSHAAAYRFAVEAPYRAFAARDGKERWGDKTPYYLARIDEIIAVWPDARFILLVRDGRDVALSIAALPFGANNVYAAAHDWAEGIRQGLEASDRHPENVLTVVYEQLVADPEEQVQRICRFLELDYTPAMLRVEDTPESKLESDKAGWFTALWAGINQNSVGKWRTRMSEEDQAVFASIAGPELAAYGYDLGANPGTLEPHGLRAARYRAHDRSRRVLNFVRLRLVQERGREVRYVVRRKLSRR